MKKWILWTLVLLIGGLCSSAMADTYILHTPTTEQIEEEEAVQIAAAFIKSMTGVELTGLYRVENGRKVKGEAEANFGPGNQWYADTAEDCWALSLRNESTISRPFVVVHGTTGEIVYWEYSDADGILYINMHPREGQHLTLEEAVVIAEEHVFEVFPFLSQEEVAIDGAFGLATNWSSIRKQFDAVPAWHIGLRYRHMEKDYAGFLIIDASSRETYDKDIDEIDR